MRLSARSETAGAVSTAMATLPGLMIVADDLGISREANCAILQALQMGFVTHASLMTNMPDFGEAASMAFQRGVTDRIGVHLNGHTRPSAD